MDSLKNMGGNINSVLAVTVNNTLSSVLAFIPRFISGLIILLLGVIIATFVKQVVVEVFKFTKLENILRRYGVPETREGLNWSQIIGELLRWFVIILFLVPACDLWGLGRFVEVLNELLRYIPNVFVAVLLLLVGFVFAKLASDVITSSIHGVSVTTRRTIAAAARWAILVFVFLAALNQLGIASDLIRILFAGFVAMIALAGGLAFGLGGREAAADILNTLRRRL